MLFSILFCVCVYSANLDLIPLLIMITNSTVAYLYMSLTAEMFTGLLVTHASYGLLFPNMVWPTLLLRLLRLLFLKLLV